MKYYLNVNLCKINKYKEVNDMSECKTCTDDKYILIGCCDGFECGCRGMPVALSNCKECNPDDDKEMSLDMKDLEYIEHLEFVKV